MDRINKRRCHLLNSNEDDECDDDEYLISFNRSIGLYSYWDCGTHIGPDVVQLITKLLRQPNYGQPKAQSNQIVYSGLINGSVQCKRSMAHWPSRSWVVCGTGPVGLTPMAVASMFWSKRLLNYRHMPYNFYGIGPECSWNANVLWQYDLLTLRKILFNPIDLIEHLSDILKRYTINYFNYYI